MLCCPPTVGPFFLLTPRPPPARLASHSSPSPPRRVFPGPPGALWADVLGFDCLVTASTANRADARALAASDGGGLQLGARGGNVEAAGTRPDVWDRGCGTCGISQLRGARCHLWALGRRAGRGGPAPESCPPPRTSGGRGAALKVALLSPPSGGMKMGLSLGAAPHVEDARKFVSRSSSRAPSARLSGCAWKPSDLLCSKRGARPSPRRPPTSPSGPREKGCGATASSRKRLVCFV